jgi:hypothetical protein
MIIQQSNSWFPAGEDLHQDSEPIQLYSDKAGDKRGIKAAAQMHGTLESCLKFRKEEISNQLTSSFFLKKISDD